MDISGNTWFVIISKPNSEKRAEYNLRKQGFEVYSPMVRVRKIKKKRLTWVSGPLFARYIFCRSNFNWGVIRSTFGVSSLVMDNEHPALLPDKEIIRIKSREGSHGYIELAEPTKFKIGEKIKITEGPFSGSDAIFDGASSAARIKALINLLGSKVRIDLSESAVAAA